jgi:hypothetical protein
METLRVERSSREAGASPDPSWRGLYWAGSVAAVLYVILIVAPLVLLIVVPPPPSSGGDVVSPGDREPLSYTSPRTRQSTLSNWSRSWD